VVQDGASTRDVAKTIGPRLAEAAIAGRIVRDGQSRIVDLDAPLPGDCELAVLTANDENSDSLHVLRHSAAHVMAEAVCTLFPGTKLAYGPPVEEGFYYDIDLDRRITPDDFAKIEQEMQRIIREDRPFVRYDLTRAEAMVRLAGYDRRKPGLETRTQLDLPTPSLGGAVRRVQSGLPRRGAACGPPPKAQFVERPSQLHPAAKPGARGSVV